MTAEEYFGDYWKYIDHKALDEIMGKLKILYSTKSLCPAFKDVFRAFRECPYNRLKVILIGQDPYPQKGVATGLAFANKPGTEVLSPSLEVLKECVIDFEKPHNYITFAPDLEEWAEQGVLLLNSALTVEMNRIGSHTNMWRPFIGKFIRNISTDNPGLIFVLLGGQAQSFDCYIENGITIRAGHPSYYARTKTRMPPIFKDIDTLLMKGYNTRIQWYHEIYPYEEQEDKECNQDHI